MNTTDEGTQLCKSKPLTDLSKLEMTPVETNKHAHTLAGTRYGKLLEKIEPDTAPLEVLQQAGSGYAKLLEKLDPDTSPMEVVGEAGSGYANLVSRYACFGTP